jgi:hypothetical protein
VHKANPNPFDLPVSHPKLSWLNKRDKSYWKIHKNAYFYTYENEKTRQKHAFLDLIIFKRNAFPSRFFFANIKFKNRTYITVECLTIPTITRSMFS